MKLHTLISLKNEPALEKWARLYRFCASEQALRKFFTTHPGTIRLVDFGCGQDILFYKFLSHRFPQDLNRIRYIGIDPLIKPSKKKSIEIISSQYESVKLQEKADICVMFAVLEHVNDPAELLLRSLSLLKTNGIVIATTPSWISKPLLEFFSHTLNIISKREIDEHKQYFSKESLVHIGSQLHYRFPRATFSHRYFELVLNNLFVVYKH